MLEKPSLPFLFKNIIADIALGVQFLSRLPVSQHWTEPRSAVFSKTVWAFPIAGLIISLPALLMAMLASTLSLPSLVVAVLVVTTQILVTGALHEDGLADVADGFGGGKTARQKLDIMKDSRIGSYGTLALGCTLLLRVGLLASLLEMNLFNGLSAFVAGQVLSRGGQVAFWATLPSARYRGLSHLIGRPDRQQASLAIGLAILLAGLLVLPLLTLQSFLALSILISGAFFAFRHLCWKHIRGQTGDTLGAFQVLIDLCVLIGVSLSYDH